MSGVAAWKRVQRSEDIRIESGVLVGFRLPKEVSVLMLDAKHFRFGRKPWTLYVAFDAEAMRPLCWILLPRSELRAGYDRMLSHFKRKGIGIKGVVSDWHKGILASAHDHYPDAVHQRCTFHVLKEVRAKSGGQRTLCHDHGRMFWKRVRAIAIEAVSLSEAERLLRSAIRRYPEYRRGLLFLKKALPDIYEFVKCPALTNHRTSNRIENCMGQIEARMKTMRGMKTPKTAAKMISSILRAQYKDQPS